ncbi:MAG: hypothetical protein NXH75_11725, partial [Halobacteriovoraceae bacterium]|nr:hypothetical protein [Halobacteriovoraceae bacterium]
DVDLIYTSNIRYDYVREPGGGLGALTGYFAVNSTKIEGRMEATGLSSVLFDELTVGNKQSKLVKIINNGFKESIVHHVDIYNSSNSHIARCSKFGGNNNLACQDPGDTGAGGTTLTLEQLPIKVTDTLGCLIDYDDKDYIRNPDKTLSISGLREVAGRTVTLPGESCLFSLTFQPSVEYLSSGNVDGYQFKFVYDSTWKNTRDIKNETYGAGAAFTLAEAKWASAAQLTVKTFSYANSPFPDIDPDTTDNDFLYDLGRIALVSDAAYKQRLNTVFKNNGGTAAEIVSIKDGDSFVFSDTAADINSYYKDAYSVNCSILNELGGECNIAMDIVPLASSNPDSAVAEAEENNNMFDVQNGYPDQYKQFIVEYKDGSTYEDDGVTPRANRVLTISARSLLVRKGFLVFEDTSTQQGQGQQLVLGDTKYYWVKLKNAGTGGIPYITTVAGATMEKPTTGDTAFPFRYVDRPGTNGEDGADKDCYDFMVHKEVAPPGMPPNTNAASVLGAGETCSMAVRIKMRQNDTYTLGQYDLNASAIQEWERPFWNGIQNSTEAWEIQPPPTESRDHDVSFYYYDGDGIPDGANGYNPDLNGYGNYYRIGGGSSGFYTVGLNTRNYARLFPDRPYPTLNGVVCRDELVLPDVIPDPTDDWGNTRTGATISERCQNYWGDDFDEEASKSPGIRDMIKTEESGYDYIYYAGTWKTGGSYALSFVLNKREGITPASALEVTGQSYTGDTGIISKDTIIGANVNTQTIDFTFSPSVDGTYETELVLSYKNDGLELIDEDNLTYSEREGTFKIKIRADAVSNIGTAELEVQDYLVTYDPDTDTVDDTTLDGAAYSFPMFLYSTDTASKLLFSAIRGGQVFAKKKLTYTNTGAFPLNDFSFNLKDGIFAGGYSNTIPGSGIAIESNSCSGVTLAPAASCEIVITFTASEFEIAAREIEIDITYQMTTETYYQENTIIRFEARDPAVLDV